MMLHGPDPSEDCGVAGIGNSRQHASYAGGVGAVFQNAAEVRNFEAVLIGFQDVIRTHAINGDHQERLRG